MKAALVTGAGSGIGRAVALRLAAGGAAVGVVDVRDGAAEDVAATIVSLGGTAEAATADVGDEIAVERAVGLVAERFGVLDTVARAPGWPSAATPTTRPWRRGRRRCGSTSPARS